MDVFREPPTSKGPAQTFTGDVWVDPVYTGPRPGQARLAVVRFAPGACTHWHSHRLGQTPHILDGTALLGSRDGMVIEAHPGDTIHTAPGEEHWHGAATDRFMAHLTLMDGDTSDAPQTTWGEPVTDAAHGAAPTSTP
jgi:quercetin dioxygenase-like cupin family protein